LGHYPGIFLEGGCWKSWDTSNNVSGHQVKIWTPESPNMKLGFFRLDREMRWCWLCRYVEYLWLLFPRNLISLKHLNILILFKLSLKRYRESV
jgi:hypothetical protein